jgi:hypothetical protein
MALNELHGGKGIPKEWFTDHAVREARWLQPFTKRLVALMYPASSDVSDVEEYLDDVAEETFDELEKRERNPGFLDPAEMVEWLFDLRDASIDEEGWKTQAEFGEKLPVLLLRPLDRYTFEADVKPAHKWHGNGFHYLVDRQFGGPHELLLQPLEHEGKPCGMRIRGVVLGGSVSGVIRRTECVLDELCGALRAAGMARFVPLPPRGMDEVFGRVVLPHITIDGTKWTGQSVELDPAYARRLSGFALTIPDDLDEMQRKLMARDDLDGALGHRHRMVQRVLGSSSPRAAELRGACRRLVEAELATDFGLTVTLAFSALEGLLLESSTMDEVLGRLSEAVVHGVGSSAEERSRLRKHVKALYKKRSIFVHTGTAREAAKDRREVLQLAYRVLRREMGFIPEDSAPHPVTK